jgi:hypothetical protein
MRIDQFSNCSVEDAFGSADSAIFGCGYEQRCRSALQELSVTPGPKGAVAIGFEELSDAKGRGDNERAFARAGIPVRNTSGASSKLVRSVIRDCVAALPNNGSLIIDISGLTRVWHAGIVAELSAIKSEKAISTTFVYVPGVFSHAPLDAPPTRHVAPLDGFASLGLPNVPTALVIGLGHEPDRALGLEALLDPALTAVCVAKNLREPRYYEEVIKSNKELIASASDWVFEYPLSDCVGTIHLVDSLCSGLSRDFRVVLVSLGPKLFALECLLLAVLNPEISVWRASSGYGVTPRDIVGDVKNAIACKVNWISDIPTFTE